VISLALPRFGDAAPALVLGDPRPLARFGLRLLESGTLDPQNFKPGMSVSEWLSDALDVRFTSSFEDLLVDCDVSLECTEEGTGVLGFHAMGPTCANATRLYAELESLCPGAGKGVLEALGALPGPMPILAPKKAFEVMEFLEGQFEGWLPQGYEDLQALTRTELEALAHGERPLIQPLFPEVATASLELLGQILEGMKAVESLLETWGWTPHFHPHDGGSWVPGYVVGVDGPHGDLAWHAARELTAYAYDCSGVETAWWTEFGVNEDETVVDIEAFLTWMPRVCAATESLLSLLGPLDGQEPETEEEDE
jgi:hypothetical protein